MTQITVLYYAMHKFDPRIQFMMAPASHVLLVISVRLNNVEKFIGYRVMVNINPGQVGYDFQEIIVTDQLN